MPEMSRAPVTEGVAMTRLIMALAVAVFAFAGLAIVPAAGATTGGDLEKMQAAVDQYADSLGLARVPYVNIPYGQIIENAYGSLASDSTAFYGRKGDKTAYIGEQMVYDLAARTHWLAPGFISAHEWGHFLWREDIDNPVTSRRQAVEDGADCIAGAWLGWINKRDNLGLNIWEDAPRFGLMVNEIARNEQSPVGDNHGTFVDRSIAIINGYLWGIQSCNHYKQPQYLN